MEQANGTYFSWQAFLEYTPARSQVIGSSAVRSLAEIYGFLHSALLNLIVLVVEIILVGGMVAEIPLRGYVTVTSRSQQDQLLKAT